MPIVSEVLDVRDLDLACKYVDMIQIGSRNMQNFTLLKEVGKLNIPVDAGHWLRNGDGTLTKKIRHICWDGCMFPNETLESEKTWENVLDLMIKVRDGIK